jgi:hypothetical protein
VDDITAAVVVGTDMRIPPKMLKKAQEEREAEAASKL